MFRYYIPKCMYYFSNKIQYTRTTTMKCTYGSKVQEETTIDKLFYKKSVRHDSANNKITVIGANEVGLASVFSLLTKRITNNVCMIDIYEDKLQGEMMDLQHGTMFLNNATIQASKDYAASANSKISVITTVSEQEPGEPRTEFVTRNVGIIRAIVPELLKYSPDTIILVASEPVDIMTYVAWKKSGLSKSRVLGTGTNLDTARFRYFLSDKLGVAASSCDGYIIGERGENSVPVWSSVNVAGVKLCDLNTQIGTDEDLENWHEVYKEVIKSDQILRELKGSNSWALALSIVDICNAILTNANSVHPVSTYVKGEYGILEEIFLSLPCVLGLSGVTDVIRQPLTETEAMMLRKSADGVAQLHIIGY